MAKKAKKTKWVRVIRKSDGKVIQVRRGREHEPEYKPVKAGATAEKPKAEKPKAKQPESKPAKKPAPTAKKEQKHATAEKPTKANGVPHLTVTGVKSFRGMEGLGFNATLLVDGKPAALVMDDARGGSWRFEWRNKKVEKRLTEYVQSTLSKRERKQSWGVQCRLETLVAYAVDSHENNKRLRRLCRKRTLFLGPQDDVSKGYRTINQPYSPKVKAWIIGKYGKDARILNEEMPQ